MLDKTENDTPFVYRKVGDLSVQSNAVYLFKFELMKKEFKWFVNKVYTVNARLIIRTDWKIASLSSEIKQFYFELTGGRQIYFQFPDLFPPLPFYTHPNQLKSDFVRVFSPLLLDAVH